MIGLTILGSAYIFSLPFWSSVSTANLRERVEIEEKWLDLMKQKIQFMASQLEEMEAEMKQLKMKEEEVKRDNVGERDGVIRPREQK